MLFQSNINLGTTGKKNYRGISSLNAGTKDIAQWKSACGQLVYRDKRSGQKQSGPARPRVYSTEAQTRKTLPQKVEGEIPLPKVTLWSSYACCGMCALPAQISK